MVDLFPPMLAAYDGKKAFFVSDFLGLVQS